jgi:ABC transporter transmembrane region 2
VARMASGYAADRYRASAIIDAVRPEFLESRFLQCDRPQGCSGPLDPGAAVRAAGGYQSLPHHPVGLEPHDHATHVARVDEQPSLRLLAGKGSLCPAQIHGRDHQTPEYRIAEDARVATDLPIDLVLGLLSALLTAITFIGVLWSVGDSLVISLDGLVVTVPGYLVIAVIVYSMLLSAATLLIARHLTRVLEENKRTEAELRSIGTHLRESGEGTALADGKKDGRHAIGAALKAVIEIWRIYCWQLMRLTLITYRAF